MFRVNQTLRCNPQFMDINMKMKLNTLVKYGIAFLIGSLNNIVHAEVLTIGQVPAAFNDAITVSHKGKILVSNAGNFGPAGLEGTQVYAMSRNGNVEVAVDHMSGPLGHAFDKQGNFYVSNFNTGAIYKRDSKSGEVSLFSSIVGGGGIAVDHQNNIFVASYIGGAIYKIDRDGNAEVFADDPLLAGGPVGISFGKRGNLYVGNYDDGKVLKIDNFGNVIQIATLEIAGNHAAYLVYAAGNLYSTSLNTNKVYKISLDGQVTEFAGSGLFGNQDGANADAAFALPNGITTNKKQDILYVSEYYSPYIRAIKLN